MKKEALFPRTDPYEVVEKALHWLELDLYGAAKDVRRMMYGIILDNLCQMLLIDGGPTFGLEVLEGVVPSCAVGRSSVAGNKSAPS